MAFITLRTGCQTTIVPNGYSDPGFEPAAFQKHSTALPTELLKVQFDPSFE